MQEIAGYLALEDIALNAGFKSAGHVDVFLMLSEKNGLGLGKGFGDFASRIQAIQHGHADIHDHNIRLECLHPLYGLAAIRSFANHLQALTLEQRAKALADEHVIVCQHYANGHPGPTWRPGSTIES